MNGWRLVGTLSLVLGAMTLYFLASHSWDIEGVRLAIRATARTSLVLFALAFTASAMVELAPSDEPLRVEVSLHPAEDVQ